VLTLDAVHPAHDLSQLMHPYRENALLVDTPSTTCPEELIFYGLLVVIGAIPVVVAIAQRVAFGGDATIGLLMIGTGLAGAVYHALRARKG
jgi:hypothetical protein